MNKDHTPEFYDACSAIMIATPFFATLLLRYKHVQDPKIPTACVSLRELRYNPDWFKSLKPEERVAVLLHEICHGIYRHVELTGAYLSDGINGKPLDPDKWARAVDYVVNATVEETGIGKLPDSALIDLRRFPAGTLPEEVYAKLDDNPNEQAMDQHGGGDDDDPELSDTPAAIDAAALINAANVARAVQGKIPGSIQRLIGELTKPTHDPYGLLRRFVSSVAAGRDNSTMKTLNRKLLVRGIGFPGRDGFVLQRVGIVIDTSGSIGDDLITTFLGNVALILQKYKPKEVRIAWTDTKVHRIDTVKNMADLHRVREKGAAGGGGTDIEQAYEPLGRCDCFVMLTDGYTPFRNPPKAPVLWAMTTNVTAPYGTTVRIYGK